MRRDGNVDCGHLDGLYELGAILIAKVTVVVARMVVDFRS
jgi:hypothetical protein